jgi:hypothetical protein
MLGKHMAAKSGNLTKLLLLALMLFLLAPMVVILSLGSPPEPSPIGGAGPKPPADTAGTGESSETSTAASNDSRTVATRALAGGAPSTEGLAEMPSACLLVVDRQSQTPIAGAALRRVQGGAEIAFTDDRGLASVPLKQPEQLAVVVDGYLLRMAPTRVGTSEEQPQRVLLVRDEWSILRRFEFVDREGHSVREAFVRFRPRMPEGKAVGTSIGPPATDKVAERAWTEHTMLAGLPVCADVPVQLGVWSQDHVHRLQNGAEVRFSAPGEFLAEVATEAGLVGQATFRLDLAMAGRPAQTVRIDVKPGDFVSGTVVGLGTMQPVTGAQVSLQGSEPLGLVATTGSDGSFRLGPLAHGDVTLHVRHGDHEPLAWGPVASNGQKLRIQLQPLPSTTLRGQVRARSDHQPIAGAQLVWIPSGGASVTAATGPDGTFQIAVTGDAASRLAISAPGFVTYAELVQPGSPFAEYDLWSADPEVRLAKGITARLVGIVVDAQGRAQPGVAVRWIPDRETPVVGVLGRRVLEGGTLELPTIVATGPDGSFQLDTTQFGSGRLCLADAGPSATGGASTAAVAGSIKDGLRLQR